MVDFGEQHDGILALDVIEPRRYGSRVPNGRLLLIGALAATLGGCWTQPGWGPGHQANNPFDGGTTVDNVDELGEAWRVSGVSGVSPIVFGDFLIAVEGPNLVARSADRGDVYWAARIFEPCVAGTPCGPPGFDPVVYAPFIGGDRKLHVEYLDQRTTSGVSISYDVFTGTELSRGTTFRAWNISETVRGADRARQSLGFVPSPPGYFVGLSTSGPAAILYFAATQPSTFPPPVIVASHAYAAVGTELFQVALSCASPCAATTRGAIADSPIRHIVAVDDDSLAITTNTGTFEVVNIDGNPEWRATGDGHLTAAAIGDGHLFVGSQTGVLAYPIDGCGTATCAAEWRMPTDAAIARQPAISGHVVYAASSFGVLSAFSTADCGASTCPSLNDLDANRPGAPVTAAIAADPVVAGGRAFVILTTGDLVAYKRS
jgi:PQQ-like domain